MTNDEIFESSVRGAGDLAGVFEHDGDTGYFYLYKTTAGKDRRVLGAIRVVVGTADFSEQDISVRWDDKESKVGLFIRGHLWAVFDTETTSQFGGDYRPTAAPAIPAEVNCAFD